jgi:TolB-like protein
MGCRRDRSVAALAVALAAVAGCSSGVTRFVHPQADLGFYESVGVVPFESLGQDRLAGEKVTNIFFTEVLRRRFADVREPGQFAAAIQRLRGLGPSERAWTAADLSRLGDEANVQGVFMGTVRDYEMTSAGRSSFPLVSIEVRLVDAGTGTMVWSASLTRRGGPTLPFTGWREIHTLGELTTVVCRDLLDTLPVR